GRAVACCRHVASPFAGFLVSCCRWVFWRILHSNAKWPKHLPRSAECITKPPHQKRRNCMNKLLGITLATGALLASTAIARADCAIGSGSVRILSNDFEALHVVASGAEECADPG